MARINLWHEHPAAEKRAIELMGSGSGVDIIREALKREFGLDISRRTLARRLNDIREDIPVEARKRLRVIRRKHSTEAKRAPKKPIVMSLEARQSEAEAAERLNKALNVARCPIPPFGEIDGMTGEKPVVAGRLARVAYDAFVYWEGAARDLMSAGMSTVAVRNAAVAQSYLRLCYDIVPAAVEVGTSDETPEDVEKIIGRLGPAAATSTDDTDDTDDTGTQPEMRLN